MARNPLSSDKQSAGRRLSTVTIDQVLSGASNILITFVAAHVLGVAAFGLFGIVFLVYVLAQGIARSLVCEPLLVHPDQAEERPGDAVGTGGVLGIGIGLVLLCCAGGAYLWDARLGLALAVLAVSLPLLVVQDLGRYLGFAVQKPRRSLALDLTWLLLLIVAVGYLFVADARSLPAFVAAWAGTGALSGLLVAWQYRGRRVKLNLSWLRETWSFSWRYLISYASTQTAALAGSLIIGAVAGAKALGGVRGALILVRPFGLFQSASVTAGIAEISRVGNDRSAMRRHVRRTTVLTTAVALVNMAVLLLLPDSLGELVLGATWHATEPLLLPATLQIVFGGLISGPRAGLLGLKAIRTAVRIDVAGMLALLVFTIFGSLIDGALGAMWGVALAQLLVALAWLGIYRRHMGRLPVVPPSDHEGDPCAHSSG